MGRIGDREWHARFDRDRDQFDRISRWMFPLCAILGTLFAVVLLVILVGGAVWLWSLVP